MPRKVPPPSPGDLLATAYRYVNDPDTALASRVASAVVIVVRGELRGDHHVTYGDVVAILDDDEVSAVDIQQALYVLREQGEAARTNA